GAGSAAGCDDTDEIDHASSAAAKGKAEEGAALARSRGLKASHRAVARRDSIADTLLAEADRSNATGLVVGSRGLGGLSSLLMGSVSHDLLQHADCPVVIIPSPEVARRRNERRRALDDAAV